MLPQTICRLPRLHVATAALSAAKRSLATAAAPKSAGEEEIQTATLRLLEEHMSKDKAKQTSDAARSYQKIHKIGDLYHPEDLNDARYQERMRQRRGRPNTPTEDPFEVLDLDPLNEYKNVRLLSYFVSDMGKILPREQTGVSAKNQRKLAKAIKRARAMGLMSCTSKARFY
ncbi:ribosomal protein S18 [Phascolomyces articulosus]|uniref:Small ribosomal subunit protein bS18m n=1 Tax=Phascolomyces articulosus TaxID=60185 RepID=A0AAD5K4T7_9FUNG|nr:ribosomal protein S18 [Phascolomyces articulosus]